MPRMVQARPGITADQRADDEVNNRLFFRLFQAANIYERQAQKVLRISAVQGAILGALSRDAERGMPLSDLVDYLAVSRQNLDGVLKRLEKLQYVERIEDADNRRIRIVRLTAAGLHAWRDLFARSLQFYRLGTDGISLPAKAAFVETLGRVNRALKAIGELPKVAPASPLKGRGARKRRPSEHDGASLNESVP